MSHDRGWHWAQLKEIRVEAVLHDGEWVHPDQAPQRQHSDVHGKLKSTGDHLPRVGDLLAERRRRENKARDKQRARARA